MQPIVELRNVSKSFGTVLALKDLNFDVEARRGSLLAGDNGAGKSTLIKVLAGVHAISKGEYLIDGAPTAVSSPDRRLDRGIATVYQDLAIVPLLSITRNFFLDASWSRVGEYFPGSTSTKPMKSSSRNSQTSALMCAIPARQSGHCPAASGKCLAIARAVYFGARVSSSMSQLPPSACTKHQLS